MVDLILSFLIIYAWMYFSLFCHEMGHFTFAKLAGMSPRLVKFGKGYNSLKLQLFNARFEFRVLPIGGQTHAYLLTLNGVNLRLFFYVIGGVFANLILLILLISLFIFLKKQECDSFIMLPLFIAIFIEVITVFCVLIPMDVKVYQESIPNDGKLIIRILNTNYQKVFKSLFKEYNKQLYRYKNGKEIIPKTFLGNDLRSLQVFLEGERKLKYSHAFEEAVELFLEVLRFKNISNYEKAFILNKLAYTVAMNGYKNHFTDADKWSKKAIKLASHCKFLKRTRGAILIELGRYEEGKQMLLPLTEPDNEALDIAISSCYIAKAEYFLGNTNRVFDWLVNAKKIDFAGSYNVWKRVQQDIFEDMKKNVSNSE